MTGLALGLVLISAVAHAGWNYIAKRASAGPVFNWLFDSLSVCVCLPLGIIQLLVAPVALQPVAAVFIVVMNTIVDIVYAFLDPRVRLS